MPRIRSIKPEFWDSPSTAQAGPWARLAFIALWNWADDFGRGTANLKELEGFCFPNDDVFTDRSGNTVNFRGIIAEVSACFGVVFYTVENRPYYAIPTWELHQRNERRSKGSKFPPPPDETPLTSANAVVAEMRGISATQERKSAEMHGVSGPGTGEQGNRGTGEQVPTSLRSVGGALPDNDAPNVETPPSTTLALLPDGSPNNDDEPDTKPAKGSRLPTDWQPDRTPGNETAEAGHTTEWLAGQLARFHDHWKAQPGAKGRKSDWNATWRNWIRRANEYEPKNQQPRTFGQLTESDWAHLMEGH